MSLADLVPTALSAIGESVPEGLDGEDLMPVILGEAAPARECVFVETVDDPRGIRLKTAVTSRHKLTYCHGQPFGELYDLEADPGERRNRWEDPALADVKVRLLSRILDFAERLEKRAPRYGYA